MPGYNAGDAFIRILPDFSGIVSRISAEAQRWGTQAGKDFSDAFNRAARTHTGGTQVGPSGSQSTRQGAQSGGAFADAFRRRVEASLRSMPDISIGAATGPAEQKIRDLKARLEALRNANIGVDLDAGAALTELRALQSELAAVSASATDIKVKADTASASAQLAAFEADLKRLSGADATVDVRLSGGFAQRVKAQIGAALDNLPEAVIGANSTQVEQKLAEIRAELATLQSLEIGVDIDAGAALARIAAVQVALAELRASDPTIDVDVDAARAQAELAAIEAEIAALNGMDATVDVDTSKGVAGFQALLGAGIILAPALIPIGAAIAAAFAGIAVATAGAAAAIGVIALALAPVVKAFMAMSAANKAAGEDARKSSKQQADAAYAVQQANQQVESAEASLANTRANSAQQAAAASRAVVDAKRAETDAVKDAADANARAAQDVADANEQVQRTEAEVGAAATRAQREVDDAKQAQSDAYRSVMDAAEDARRAVADAERNVADVTRTSSRAIESALERQADAEQNLADAQRKSQAAQEALTDARKAAEDQLEDLQSRAANGALDERDAVFDLTDKTEALRRTRESLANGESGFTEDDVDRALLKYDEAVQKLADIRLENQRVAEAKAEADAKGVEGSDLVVNAQQGIADATAGVTSATESAADAEQALVDTRLEQAQRLTDANVALQDAISSQGRVGEDNARRLLAADRALSDATQAQRQQRFDGARQIEDAEKRVTRAVDAQAKTRLDGLDGIEKAERRVADAARAQAEQRRQSAFSIAQAEQGVANAQQNAARAAQQNADTSSKAQRDLAKALGGLTPAGQAFVTFLYDKLRPALGGLSAAAQTGLLPGLQKGLESVLPLLPALKGFVGKIAGVLGDLFAQAGKGLAGPAFSGLFSMLGDVLPGVLRTMGSVIGNLAKGLAGLFTAVIPLGLRFGESLNGTLERFANWAATLNSSEGFKGFVEYAKESLPLVGGFFANLFQVIGKVIEVAAPFGAVLLGALSTVFDLISKIPTAVLAGIFLALGVAIAALAGGAIATAAAFTLVGIGFTYLLRYADDVWAFLTDKLGPAFTWLNESVVQPALAGISAAFDLWWTRYTQPILAALDGLIRDVVGPTLLWLWNNVVTPAFDGISSAISTAWSAGGTGIKAVLNAVMDAVGRDDNSGLRGIFTTAQTAISTAWNAVWGVVKKAWSNEVDGLQAIFGFLMDIVGRDDNSGLRGVFTSAKKTITDAWNAVWGAVKGAWSNEVDGLKAIFGFIRDIIGRDSESGLRGAFGDAKDTITGAWNSVWGVIKNAWSNETDGFKTIFGFITDTVGGLGGVFDKAVTAIKTAWDGLRAVAAAPINFIVDTVLNNGLIKAFNSVSSKFGGPEIPNIPLPDSLRPASRQNPGGYATGGLIQGPYLGPTADNVLIRANPREFMHSVPAVDYYGVDFMDALNRRLIPKSILPGFAGGGLIGRAVGAVKGVGSNVFNFATGPTDWFKDKVEGYLGGLSGFADTSFGQVIAAVPRKLADLMLDKVKDIAGNIIGKILPGDGDGDGLFKPVAGPYGLTFGNTYKDGSFHSGQDFPVPEGTPVGAAAAGRVVATTDLGDRSYGRFVTLEHSDGWRTLYAHLQQMQVQVGQTVARGVQIALSGNYGNSTGPHLHFEVQRPPGGYSNTVDPLPFLRGAAKFDSGGYLEPGLQVVYNGTGKPEPVFTEAQFSALSSSSTSSVERNYHYHAAEGRTMAEDDFLEAGARAEVLMAGW